MARRGPEILARVPLGEMGKPDDIAEMVCWLSSERAKYVSGAAYNVDGGLWQARLGSHLIACPHPPPHLQACGWEVALMMKLRHYSIWRSHKSVTGGTICIPWRRTLGLASGSNDPAVLAVHLRKPIPRL